jgi:hypothetical protein
MGRGIRQLSCKPDATHPQDRPLKHLQISVVMMKITAVFAGDDVMIEFTVYIENIRLRQVVENFVLQTKLDGFAFVDHMTAADVTIAADAVALRLGAVIDWLMVRRDDPHGRLPDNLSLSTGVLMLASSTFTRHSGETLRLTDKERDLMVALYRAPHQRMNKNDVLRQVWGYVEGLETHTLETHIYRLRQKIEQDPANPSILVTDINAYRLVIDIPIA